MSALEAKRAAALAACEDVREGMIVGLGTGSTAEHAVRRLGELVRKDGLDIKGVPTSLATERIAREVGLPLIDLNDAESIDITIDGADEVDLDLNLVKGLGGALLREKVVASITRRQIIIVDESKLVSRLATKAPLPVEVLPFGWKVVERKLKTMGHMPTLRTKEGKPFVTDNGNYVLDTKFVAGIVNAYDVEREINNIPGVVENGLFLGMTWKVVVGETTGKTRAILRK